MKKVILMMLSVIFVSFTINTTALAKDGKSFEEICETFDIQERDIITVFSENEMKIKIKNALENCENVGMIYDSECANDMTPDKAKDLYNEVLRTKDGTWLWGNVEKYDMATFKVNGKMHVFYHFDYKLTKDQKTAEEMILDSYVSEIKEMDDFSNLSEKDKAKLVYDLVINIYEYDYDLAKEAYYPYGAIVENDNKAVCQAYSLTYWYIANEIGVDTKVVARDDLKHSWNVSKVNGRWYSVDCTRGDSDETKNWFLFTERREKIAKTTSFYEKDFTISVIPYAVANLFGC